jgi:hypothetical protein
MPFLDLANPGQPANARPPSRMQFQRARIDALSRKERIQVVKLPR